MLQELATIISAVSRIVAVLEELTARMPMAGISATSSAILHKRIQRELGVLSKLSQQLEEEQEKSAARLPSESPRNGQ